MNKHTIVIAGIFINLFFCFTLFSQEDEFQQLKNENWKPVFEDDFRSGLRSDWVLDGRKGKLLCTPEGMEFYAGKRAFQDEDHAVLWLRKHFSGDIKIEYDYTRLDSSSVESVNIIYLHASGNGQGDYVPDIFEWNELREIPAMKVYFNHMNAYHISYAVTGPDSLLRDYIRARRYMPDRKQGLKGTALLPEYLNTGLFKPGIKHHITVILRKSRLYMEVQTESETRLFWFDTESLPPLSEGYIGLRQMWTRAARYSDFKVSVPD
jgi:Domain of unknown function (DUF1961).